EIERLITFAEGAVDRLQKILAQAAPPERMQLTIFSSIDAANEFAQRAGAGDHSSVFPGYVLEADPEKPAIALFDGGAGKGFAHLHVAHAAAHTFLDKSYPQADRIPEWFAEGLAAYVDRFIDPDIRKWSMDKLVQRGGLTSVEKLADLKLVAADPDGAQKKLFEAGLVIAYFAEKPDKADADRFKKAAEALKKVAGRDAAIQKLLQGGSDLEKRVRSFAGFGK
ncbi:MAG TPA: hypothetical protein VKE69_14490, partial [Planctomycetota bacterium]|nr:hypothetical protein [Planctomycetota bacterium]